MGYLKLQYMGNNTLAFEFFEEYIMQIFILFLVFFFVVFFADVKNGVKIQNSAIMTIFDRKVLNQGFIKGSTFQSKSVYQI